MKVEDDRLSMLPDDLIHKILSFISIKHAIKTSALSSRWRYIWNSVPYINISTHDFANLRGRSKHVKHFLSRRNGQIELYSVKLSFHQTVRESLLKTILDYAFSHNVQQLTITCLFREKIAFPLHTFHSHSLKYLRLSGSRIGFLEGYNIILASTWELPALTTLHLDRVAFNVDNDDNNIDLFSKCVNLKNLTLNNFKIKKSLKFRIFHPQLSNLILEDAFLTVSLVNVVAPLLENLTIIGCHAEHLIDAPNLASLVFHSPCNLEFSSDLHSLVKVDLCICSKCSWSDCKIVALLQQLHNVKFLRLNLEFIKFFLPPLISDMEQIPLQHSPFFNLKRLIIYPVKVLSDDEAHKKVNMSTEVINYLLDGSPSATFTLISYEEIKEKQQKLQAFVNARKAQERMASLQETLDDEKANIESNRTRMDRGKTPMEGHEADGHVQGTSPVEKMQLRFQRKMTQMQSYLEDARVQIDQGRRKTCDIISQLRGIEVLLLKDLPTSKRDELQACFSRLCTEVDTVAKKILHHMSIPQILLSGRFNELATTSLQSS